MREALTAALRKQIVIIKRQAEVMQEQLDHAQMLLALLDPEQEALPGLGTAVPGGQPELISESPVPVDAATATTGAGSAGKGDGR